MSTCLVVLNRLFSYYQIYQYLDPRCAKLNRITAEKNGKFAVGIDIDFYPAGLYVSGHGKLKQFRCSLEYILSSLKWLFANYQKGWLVLPLPILCFFGDLLALFFDSTQNFKSYDNISEYFLNEPESEFNNELIATYIRFIASNRGRYDLERLNFEHLNILIWRWKIYKTLIKMLFMLGPSVYVTWQRSYLNAYTPCMVATKQSIPILLLGASDRSLFKCSDTKVPRHWEWIRKEDITKVFNSVEEQNDGIKKASNNLEERFLGCTTDKSLINYMYFNPYSVDLKSIKQKEILEVLGYDRDKFNEVNSTRILKSEFKDNFICIYMHMFDDYHHHGVLPSFASSYYHWLNLTISILRQGNVPFIIKLHPTLLSPQRKQIARRVIAGLNSIADEHEKSLNISFSMNTKDLIHSGMKLGVTVCGTITTELICLKIPVLCSGNPPYRTFMKRRTASNFEEYRKRLLSYTKERAVQEEEVYEMLKYLAYREHSAKFRLPPSKHDIVCANNYGLVVDCCNSD